MKSLLAKAEGIKQQQMHMLNSETEKDIALTILALPTVLLKSKEAKSLNDIAEYLYKLTALYNKFYAENKVLVEENQQQQQSWLVLTKLVYDINMLLLDVLGLKVPEKM
jgi:arginyl-tRNA synthetase